jgi:pimeloyl-ACP methyl ester carboxylesterase
VSPSPQPSPRKWGEEAESRYADVNGVRLHYRTAGSGPLMLFVHGFPETSLAWTHQVAEFSRDHHAVAPDTRGIGQSSRPEGVRAYHVSQQTEDLRQLIRHLGHEQCVLVAHDWGGACAWHLAHRHPELLHKLVIVNSPHPVLFARELARNEAQQQASDYMVLFRLEKAERVLSEDNFRRLAAHFREWGRAGGRPADPALIERYRQAWAQPGCLTAALNYYRASPLYPPTPQDPGAAKLQLRPQDFTVRVPTLVIWGEQDTALLPGILDGLDECVPDLRLERIPEGSHWVIHEFPERVNRLIRDFIGRP